MKYFFIFISLIFTFNVFVRIKFKYKYGFFKKNKSNLYVTSGAGCWGPKMQLGTFNEIIIINLISKWFNLY